MAQGFRLSNTWFSDTHPRELERVVNALSEAFEAQVPYVDLTREDGLPWVTLTSAEVMSPRRALVLGSLLEQALGQSVRFQQLRSHDVTFIAPEAIPGKSFKAAFIADYGTPLAELRDAWRELPVDSDAVVVPSASE